MIFAMVSGPARPKRGRPRTRDPKHYLVALEYILWPVARPPALQKQLAFENGIKERDVSRAVYLIKRRMRTLKKGRSSQ